ncbi:MAG: DUF1501 domain-containing protein [Verrucomicrobiota bacterium]
MELARRNFLQLGLGALGGLGIPDLLRLRAEAAERTGKKKDVKCIFVWLDGGPSHYETFDPKPAAPSEVRGEFGTIKTSIPGVHYSEHVPHLAKVADKCTIIRSIAHDQNNHGAGNHYLVTGSPTPVPVGCGAFVTFHPSVGSVVSWQRGAPEGLPPYVSMPRMSRSGGPHFLGAEYAPFVISESPTSGSFRVRDVSLPRSLTEARAGDRRTLRASLDQMERIQDKAAEDPTVAFDQFYQDSYRLISSARAQSAFDIGQEPDQTRERYGRNSSFGQRLLLARRLTEVGVPFVMVYDGGWDHHRTIFPSLKKKLPNIDQGLAALIADLDERGSLDDTLVVCLGEFGRTPKINDRGGRDHWSYAMSVLMAGAGVPRGQVVGATDPKGYYAIENVYAPEDFAASLYTKLGVDHRQILHTPAGRPVQLVNKGRLIKEMFA